jgi:hypothetical protein
VADLHAERAFLACEPENRLVARTLETRRETALADAAEAEAAIAAQAHARPGLQRAVRFLADERRYGNLSISGLGRVFHTALQAGPILTAGQRYSTRCRWLAMSWLSWLSMGTRASRFILWLKYRR